MCNGVLFLIEPRVLAYALPGFATVSRTAVFPAVNEVLRLIELVVGTAATFGRCAGQKRQMLQSLVGVESKCSVACPGTEVLLGMEKEKAACAERDHLFRWRLCSQNRQ